MRLFLALFFAFTFYSRGQVKDRQIELFSNDLCSCLEKKEGSFNERLRKCTIDLGLNKNGKHKNILVEFSRPGFDIEGPLWTKINARLANDCDTYNTLLSEKLIGNKKFSPELVKVGKEVCLEFKKVKSLNSETVEKIMIPKLKENQAILLKIYDSPSAVFKNLNQYLYSNCKAFRKYISIEASKK